MLVQRLRRWPNFETCLVFGVPGLDRETAALSRRLSRGDHVRDASMIKPVSAEREGMLNMSQPLCMC